MASGGLPGCSLWPQGWMSPPAQVGDLESTDLTALRSRAGRGRGLYRPSWRVSWAPGIRAQLGKQDLKRSPIGARHWGRRARLALPRPAPVCDVAPEGGGGSGRPQTSRPTAAGAHLETTPTHFRLSAPCWPRLQGTPFWESHTKQTYRPLPLGEA